MTDYEIITATIGGECQHYVKRNKYPRLFLRVDDIKNLEADKDSVLDPCTDALELATAMRETMDFIHENLEKFKNQ